MAKLGLDIRIQEPSATCMMWLRFTRKEMKSSKNDGGGGVREVKGKAVTCKISEAKGREYVKN